MAASLFTSVSINGYQPATVYSSAAERYRGAISRLVEQTGRVASFPNNLHLSALCNRPNARSFTS